MAWITPRAGVGLAWLMGSKKARPGSPEAWAWRAISSHRAPASTSRTTWPVRGFLSGQPPPALTAAKKSRSTMTERLKLASRPGRSLARMNTSMSGWLTASRPMLAPRRVPPCLMASVAVSNTCMKLTGPELTPPVEATTSPAGRSWEKEKPVPPPDLWIRAVLFTASKMLSSESSTGSTKQAANWPRGRPAFMRVGELGRNRPSAMRPKKRGAHSPALPPYTSSAWATARATRSSIWRGLSCTRPCWSRTR